VFDEIPHSEKVLKRHQNSDDPCIMAWDHYTIRSDRGGEFLSRDFKELHDRHGIKREYTIPCTPQQNGVVECQNRSVQ
jgi:transposase InsO family protein